MVFVILKQTCSTNSQCWRNFWYKRGDLWRAPMICPSWFM